MAGRCIREAMDRRTAFLIGGGIAAGALAWLWLGRDGADPIDVIGDAVAELTSSEETRLAQLQPDARAAALQLIAEMAARGYRVRIGQTLRSPAQEKAVIDAGRSAVKSHSWHELGRALDAYPEDPATGKDAIGNDADLYLYREMHDAAAAIGFRGIAFNADGSKRFITNAQGKKIWDGGHLEWRAPYGTIAEAVAAEGSAYGIA